MRFSCLYKVTSTSIFKKYKYKIMLQQQGATYVVSTGLYNPVRQQIQTRNLLELLAALSATLNGDSISGILQALIVTAF